MVLGTFPALTLTDDGDSVTFTCKVKLGDLTYERHNRVFWGMGDTRPEEHGLLIRPDLHPNGWKLTNRRSLLVTGGVDVDFAPLGFEDDQA